MIRLGLEQIDTALWDDDRFYSLTRDGKLVYLWMISCSPLNPAGIYKVRRDTIEGYTKVRGRALDTALDELERADLALYDGRRVFVVHRVKKLRRAGLHPNRCRAIASILGDLRPEHPMRVAFLERYGDERFSRSLAAALTDLRSETEGVRRQGESTSLDGPLTEGPTVQFSPSSPSSKEDFGAIARTRTREAAGDVQAVWDYYVAALGKNGNARLETHQADIVAALRVATVEECCKAIDGLASSDHHRDGGWTQIRYALRGGGRGRGTDRQRIEAMIERAERTAQAASKPDFSYLDRTTA